MAYDPADELKDALSQVLLGHPYDPSSTAPETFLAGHLSYSVGEWSRGEMEWEDLIQEFQVRDLGNFDFLQWITEKADEGHYAIPT